MVIPVQEQNVVVEIVKTMMSMANIKGMLFVCVESSNNADAADVDDSHKNERKKSSDDVDATGKNDADAK